MGPSARADLSAGAGGCLLVRGQARRQSDAGNQTAVAFLQELS